MEEVSQHQPTPKRSKANIGLVITLIVIVLLALGGGAYAWMQILGLTSTNDDLNSQVSSLHHQLAAAQATPTPTPTPTPTSAPATIKVSLTQWGVSFMSTVPVMATYNTTGKVYVLKPGPVTALGGTCTADAFATISRHATGTTIATAAQKFATVGAYDYYYGLSEAPCETTDAAAAVITGQTTLLTTALQSLK